MNDLFSYSNCEYLEYIDVKQFYDCTLKVQIGSHKPGENFECLSIRSNNEGTKQILQLYAAPDFNTVCEDYEINCSIGKRLI